MTRRLTAQQKAALPLLIESRDMLKGAYRAAVQKAIDLIEGREESALTDLECKALPPGAVLLDPKHPGLMLKHGARTGKRWFFRTTKPLSTTQTLIMIGPYPEVTIADARAHREEMAAVRNTNKLPVSPMLSDKSRYTVGDLFDWYLGTYCAEAKRESSTESDRLIIERYLRPEFGHIPIEDWNADHITGFLHNLFNATAKGRQAQKCMAILSAANNAARGQSRLWAGRVEWLRDIPNPMQNVARLPNREKIKAKAPTNYKPPLSEIQALWRNIDILGQPNADALRLQLLTCSRISEVTGLHVSELDLDAGRWVLPAERAKNGREHIVMLPDEAALLLKRRLLNITGTWVFPSQKWPEEHVSSETVMKAIAGNRAALGVSDRFTSHAIRHACLTWCAENGIGREVRDRISNHAPAAGVDSHYVAAELNEPARLTLQRWAQAVTAKAGQVVQLKR
nr:tyrosine-type recombinase/integrase [uncultured Ruegeria sp.]